MVECEAIIAILHLNIDAAVGLLGPSRFSLFLYIVWTRKSAHSTGTVTSHPSNWTGYQYVSNLSLVGLDCSSNKFYNVIVFTAVEIIQFLYVNQWQHYHLSVKCFQARSKVLGFLKTPNSKRSSDCLPAVERHIEHVLPSISFFAVAFKFMRMVNRRSAIELTDSDQI